MNYGPNDNEISVLYQGEVDPAEVSFDPVEVAQIDYFSLAELAELLKNRGLVFSYWFEQIMLWSFGRPSALQVLETYTGSSAK
jgi:isopentenyldiphosphate isomerase